MTCMSFKNKWTAWSAAAVLAVALGAASTAVALEEPVPPVPPVPPTVPPAEATPPGEKPVTTSPLDQDYVFDDNGRRDPFTFTKNIAIQAEAGPVAKVEGEEQPQPGVAPEIVKKKRDAADLACNMAEAFLMDLDPNSAIAKTEQGMEEFKDVPELFKYPELEVAKGRLLRARKAGETMRTRQTAQRDFDAMKIQITGVMARAKNPNAIINSEIVHKGSMIKSNAEAADVMVDEIANDRVVFVFRGYRMMMLLEGGAR